MPFALVTIGLLMIVTGARDTHKCFALELQSDFTGAPRENFIWWLAALGAIGAVSYIPGLRRPALLFMALVIIVMVLAQQQASAGGFFGQFVEALKTGPQKIDPAACNASSDTASTPQGGIETPLGKKGATSTPEGKWLGDKLQLPAWLIPWL